MVAPTLRFKGFSEKWEVIRLGKYLSHIGSGVTPKGGRDVYKSQGVMLIRSQNVNNNTLLLDDVVYIDEVTHEKMKSSTVYPNDVLLNITGGSIGRTAVVPNEFDKANVNQHVCILRPNHDLSSYFLKTYLESSLGQKNIFKDQAGQTREALNMQQIKDFDLGIPKLCEQEKIADFFSNINQKIQLQQEKIELLKEQKKGIIQKIFNQELRFKDEESEEFPKWQKYKLSDFTERVIRKNKELITTRPLTISAQYGLIDQVEFFNKTIASENLEGYYLLNKGEFAYNKSYSNGYPLGTIKRLDKYDNGALSTLYICFKALSNVDSDFLVHYFDSVVWHKEVSMICVEGARNHGLLNVSVNEFFETVHILPSKKEQQIIAEFLNKLNSKINLNVILLNNLLKQKQAFMQQMFI